MHVGGHEALRHRQLAGAAQRHVLADGGDGVRDRIMHRSAARIGRRLDRLDIIPDDERDAGNVAGHGLKLLVLGQEIGFGIDLDHDTGRSGRCNRHKTLGSRAAGLLGSLREALLAQPVDCGFHVAAGFHQRVLAVHHACVGLVAQFFHQSGRNHGHLIHLSNGCRTHRGTMTS